jgi:precorrin-4 methylase
MADGLGKRAPRLPAVAAPGEPAGRRLERPPVRHFTHPMRHERPAQPDLVRIRKEQLEAGAVIDEQLMAVVHIDRLKKHGNIPGVSSALAAAAEFHPSNDLRESRSNRLRIVACRRRGHIPVPESPFLSLTMNSS